MKKMCSSLSRLSPGRWLLTAVLGMVAMAKAGSWTSIPQPLILGAPGHREIASADAGSSLVMDHRLRMLYTVNSSSLTVISWTGSSFLSRKVSRNLVAASAEQEEAVGRCYVKQGSALVVDQGWHSVYYISGDDQLVCCQRVSRGWSVKPTVQESITQVLGVDQSWHIVYAYDAARQAIVAVHWNEQVKQWASEVIASDIGTAGGEGAVDGAWHVLYSVHESAQDATDTEGAGTLKAWPLVATWWTGKEWRSEVVDRTGVSQRPALRAETHRVYYTRRAELESTRWFQPPANPFTSIRTTEGKTVKFLTGLLSTLTTSLGSEAAWQGQETYIDDESWPVNYNPDYLLGDSFGLIKTTSGSLTIGGIVPTRSYTPVKCYVPHWESVPLPDRLSGYSAVIHPKRGELVQQRTQRQGGVAYQATSWEEVDGVYRDNTGKYVRYPVMGGFYGSLGGGSDTLAALLANPYVTQDLSTPLPASYEGWTTSSMRTFGQRLANHSGTATRGGRYQDYFAGQDFQATAGGIAVDAYSTFTFYTQAPYPEPIAMPMMMQGVLPPPDAAKLGKPTGSVWVVVVY